MHLEGGYFFAVHAERLLDDDFFPNDSSILTARAFTNLSCCNSGLSLTHKVSLSKIGFSYGIESLVLV